MSRVAFLAVCAALTVLGFFVASFVTPPDPYSQLRATAGILLLVFPASYWLVYRRGVSFRD